MLDNSTPRSNLKKICSLLRCFCNHVCYKTACSHAIDAYTSAFPPRCSLNCVLPHADMPKCLAVACRVNFYLCLYAVWCYCTDVCVKPTLQPVSGECFSGATAITDEGARLDIASSWLLPLPIIRPSPPTTESVRTLKAYL